MLKRDAIPLVVAMTITAVVVGLLVVGNLQPSSPTAGAVFWNTTRAFDLPRRALSAVAHRGYLYIVGGVDGQGRYVDTVEFSAIGADGSLGSWHRTSALSQGRFYLATVAQGDYLYALGGGSGDLGDNNRPVATVERAHVLPNGSLSPWEPLAGMNTPRRGLKAVVYNGYIYALGGYNGKFLRTMERAHIAEDGTLGAWVTEANEAVVDRYIHSATLFKHFLVLLGGHMQNSDSVSFGDVELAPVRQDASIGNWRMSGGPLSVPRFMASAFSLGSYLYIAGGHNGAARLDSVEYAAVNPFGEVDSWRDALPLHTARSAAAVAVDGNRVYIAGGISDQQVLNTVETVSQGAAGRLLP